jgi:hypothetical protein
MPNPPWWNPSHLHHSPQDQAEWAGYSVDTRAAADSAAALVLWAATGRRFEARPATARPVLCQVTVSDADMVSAPWCPAALGSGEWVNLPAGTVGAVDPTRVRLRGPVNTVASVTVDGVVIPAGSWRLDQMEWLVRTDGDAWPLWQDLSLPSGATGTFEVVYTVGEPVPDALWAAAGDYALEWARASSPNSSTLCRLPARAKEITRQGVSMTMVDPTALLRDQLTGIPSIDGVIRALNPGGQTARPRVLTPFMDAPVVG